MTKNDLLMTNAKKSLSGERFKIFEKNLNTSGLNRDELSNQIRSQSLILSKNEFSLHSDPFSGKNSANKFSENDNLDQYDSNSEISDNSLIVSRQTKSKLEISLPSDFSQKSKIIGKAIFLKNIPERIARKTIGNFERTSRNQANLLNIKSANSLTHNYTKPDNSIRKLSTDEDKISAESHKNSSTSEPQYIENYFKSSKVR